jgi:hypothetical protein
VSCASGRTVRLIGHGVNVGHARLARLVRLNLFVVVIGTSPVVRVTSLACFMAFLRVAPFLCVIVPARVTRLMTVSRFVWLTRNANQGKLPMAVVSFRRRRSRALA